MSKNILNKLKNIIWKFWYHPEYVEILNNPLFKSIDINNYSRQNNKSELESRKYIEEKYFNLNLNYRCKHTALIISLIALIISLIALIK